MNHNVDNSKYIVFLENWEGLIKSNKNKAITITVYSFASPGVYDGPLFVTSEPADSRAPKELQISTTIP